MVLQQDAKELIADAAAALVNPGQAIAISAGTTTYAVARRLLDVPRLTVVTNSVPVADVLYHGGRPDQTVILTGGVRTPSDALAGPFAVAALRTVNVDLVLMGVHGMDPRAGFTTPNMLEAETDRALVEAARRLVVVADHTKWGVIGVSTIARLAQADLLISDAGSVRDAPGPSWASRSRSWSSRVSPSRAGRWSPGVATPLEERAAVTDTAPGERVEAPDLRRAQPHRRYDPLLDRWVLVSVGRTRRPWNGSRESTTRIEPPRYDPKCYLCPGNMRANGEHNPDYPGTFVFTNDFAALQPDSPTDRRVDGLLVTEGERGTSRVVCFSPRHDLGMASMAVPDIRTVVDMWADQTTELGRQYRWVQVFENRGTEMGASSPHPARPDLGRLGAAHRRRPRGRHPAGLCAPSHEQRLLLAYAAQERAGHVSSRRTQDWLVVVPVLGGVAVRDAHPAARPGIPPRRPGAAAPGLPGGGPEPAAAAVRRAVPAPVPLLHGLAPGALRAVDERPLAAARPHPAALLRQNVRKFMVGYELLAEPQRDITPEDAAEQLRGRGVPIDRWT